jgi:hypothetical protein
MCTLLWSGWSKTDENVSGQLGASSKFCPDLRPYSSQSHSHSIPVYVQAWRQFNGIVQVNYIRVLCTDLAPIQRNFTSELRALFKPMRNGQWYVTSEARSFF